MIKRAVIAKTVSGQKSLPEKVNDWITRRWWRHQSREAHAAAFKISAMGQDNPNAQAFLNVARDNLYLAAREFDLLADHWQRGKLTFTPRKRPKNL